MTINIIPFEPRLATSFKELNIAWLQEYFYVEAKDILLLDHCQENIIDKGGSIFFAQLDQQIAGCFSLLYIDNNTFELGKMAVAKAYQGMRVGHRLLEHAIEFSIQKNISSVILYSNTKLGPALHLYRKFGFKQIEMENPAPYERSNIKMELLLS